MLAVNYHSEIITVDKKNYIPILDSECSLKDLIIRLIELDRKYDIKSVFLAGDSIVGSCADIGDYTCLVGEL